MRHVFILCATPAYWASTKLEVHGICLLDPLEKTLSILAENETDEMWVYAARLHDLVQRYTESSMMASTPGHVKMRPTNFRRFFDDLTQEKVGGGEKRERWSCTGTRAGDTAGPRNVRGVHGDAIGTRRETRVSPHELKFC